MELHEVSALLGRRVSEEDGSVEYKVRWHSNDETELPPSWEPRASLLEDCASAVADVDMCAEAATTRRLADWYRKQQPHVCNTQHDAHISNTTSSGTDGASAEEGEAPVMYTLLWSDDTAPASPQERRVGRPSHTHTATVATTNATSGNESSSTSSETKLKHSAAVPSYSAPPPPLLLQLGELTLRPDVATALTSTTHKRQRTTHHNHNSLQASNGMPSSEAEAHCQAALRLERRWKEEMGTSLLHSCMTARRVSALPAHFVTGDDMESNNNDGVECCNLNSESNSHNEGVTEVEECVVDEGCTTLQAMRAAERSRAAGLEIVGIAPIESSKAGIVYRDPFSLSAMIGEEEAERLKRESGSEFITTNAAGNTAGSSNTTGGSASAVAQELLRERREQMMVRYLVTVPEEEVHDSGKNDTIVEEGQESATAHCEQEDTQAVPQRRVLAAMPLSVFRLAFPQLLLDYLLQHSVVLEGGTA